MPETNVLTSILNSLYDDGNVIDGYTPLRLRDELVFHVKSLFKLTKLQYSINYVKVGGFKAGISITQYFKLYYR